MTDQINRPCETLLIKRAQSGDGDAFDELLCQHMKLIHMLAGRMQTSLYLHDDLVQAGRIGFMEALRKYNDRYNTRLITYAVPWIIGEMKLALRSSESKAPLQVWTDYLDTNMEQVEETGDESCLVSRIDLKTAYEALDIEEQKILLLRYFRDKTQRETALILKKSQGQISKAERRILDLLRRQLA